MESTGQEHVFDVAEALRVLEATPATLHALLGGLPDAWLHYREDPEAWSPHTVLVHFIHNERANWIPRMRVMLSEAEVRKFAPFQQLPEEDEYPQGEIGGLLRQFAQLREESLSTLNGFNLRSGDLDREGEHPILGRVSLRQLLATWVVHDLNHLHQVAKSLAKRYGDSVGPWRQNLAILEL